MYCLSGIKMAGAAATAAAPSLLASSVEKTNHIMLIRLIIDGGTMARRKTFDRFHPPSSLLSSLNANYPILNNLLRRRVLHITQWDLLFPPDGATPDSETFDITLLFLRLSNICGLTPPLAGWHRRPPLSDTSLEANITRIKYFRNMVLSNMSTIGIDTTTLNALWQEISPALVSLGLDQAEIDRLKAEHWGVEDYHVVENDWADSVPSIVMAAAAPSTLASFAGKTLGDNLGRQMIKEAHKTQLEILEDVKSKRDGEYQFAFIRYDWLVILN